MLQKNRLRYSALALILLVLAGIFAVRVSESFTEAEQDTQPLAVTTGLAVLGTVDSDAYLNGTVEGGSGGEPLHDGGAVHRGGRKPPHGGGNRARLCHASDSAEGYDGCRHREYGGNPSRHLP